MAKVKNYMRCTHFLPYLILSMHCRVTILLTYLQYNLASLAFRALSGLAPDYLAGDCQLVAVSRRRSLRSAERRVCHVPRQNSTVGDRSFAAASPRTWMRTWIELPFSLRERHWAIADYSQQTLENILRARFTNVDQAWTKFKFDLDLGLAIFLLHQRSSDQIASLTLNRRGRRIKLWSSVKLALNSGPRTVIRAVFVRIGDNSE